MDGNFYSVGLSKKKNVIITGKIDNSKLSNNDIDRLSDILPRDMFTKSQQTQGATGGGVEINIPKLSLGQIKGIESKYPELINNLKDADGKEHVVIILQDGDGTQIAYKMGEGNLGKITQTRRGNNIIKENISSNDLSESLRNQLEKLLVDLDIGYTKSGEGVTEGSQIVAGARRKTRGVTQTSTGAAGTSSSSRPQLLPTQEEKKSSSKSRSDSIEETKL